MSAARADADGRATNRVSRQSASSSSSCSIAGHADHIIILQFIAATHGPAGQLIFSITSYWTSELPNHAYSPMIDVRDQSKPSLSILSTIRTIQGHSLLLCYFECVVRNCPIYCARPRLCYVRRYYTVV